MRKNLFLIFALITLAILPGVLALQITSQDTVNVVHNSVISIPFVLNNAGGLITNLSINITALTNSSQIINVPINDPSKKSINASSTINYSIDNYPIAQYVAAGSYPVTISVAGNESGTSISATKAITINVNQTKSMALSSSGISISASPGTTPRTTFTITNNGNVNITNIVFSQSGTMQDNDNDTITLSLTSTSSLALLQPGQTVTINVDSTVPSNEDYNTYNTNLLINSTEGVSATIPYTVVVSQSFCDKGNKGGFFDLEITEPDSGDDFYPNDVIPVEVKVRNNDDDERDVVIVANLFDATDNEFLDAEVETDGTVGDNTYEYFSIDLTVPVEVKDGHNYRIYSKVYEDGNEDTQCIEDYVSIDIKKNTHDVAIDNVDLPESVSCDSSFDATIKLINMGKRNEDVKVKITNTELNIDEEKTLTLDTESKKNVVLTDYIPKDAVQGNHSLKIQAFFHLVSGNYENSVTKTVAVDVEGNCVVQQSNLVLTTEVLDTPYSGQQFSVKLNLFNTGDKTQTYSITASGYENWARLDKIEPFTLALNPSEAGTAYIYLTPLNVSGNENFKAKVIYGGKSTEKVVNVAVNQKISAPQAYQGFITKLSNLSGFDLVTVNVILVIAIILVILWILRVRRAY